MFYRIRRYSEGNNSNIMVLLVVEEDIYIYNNDNDDDDDVFCIDSSSIDMCIYVNNVILVIEMIVALLV